MFTKGVNANASFVPNSDSEKNGDDSLLIKAGLSPLKKIYFYLLQ